MFIRHPSRQILSVLLCALATSHLAAQQRVTADAGTIDAEKTKQYVEPRPYSPCAGRTYPTRPLWGATHLHTIQVAGF